MNGGEVTPREALTRLGASTAAAIARALEMLMPDGVERGEVTVVAEGITPFANLTAGAVATSVAYVNGVTGANIFVMTPAGARALAGAMGVDEPPSDQTPDALSELELSAVGEAANQMMAAAAGAIGVVLGQQIEISPPTTQVLQDTQSAIDFYGKAPHATSTTFLIAGEPCRLIQLVPSAFVVRMAQAIEEQAGGAESLPGHGSSEEGGFAAASNGDGVSLTDALRDINLRVWAELGRTRLALGQALDLPLGAVIDLDRPVDAPIDLFVNGLRFGQGHLLVTDDGEWAFQLDALVGTPSHKPGAALIEGLPIAMKGSN
jgi:flagellar motor switch protein FliN/FliY